jgi:hypothetical protein
MRFISLFFVAALLQGADIELEIEKSAPVNAFSSARSKPFEMKAGDLVRVGGKRAATSQGDFGIDAYVYTAKR